MHTPSEIISLDVANQAADLLAAFAQRLTPDHNGLHALGRVAHVSNTKLDAVNPFDVAAGFQPSALDF